MSKENTAEDIDLNQIAADDQLQQEEVIDEVHLSPTEQKAFDQGWRPQEDFEGPEDNWKTAKEYVRDGEFLATIKDLNQKISQQGQEFNDRLANSNKMHEARRQSEIAKLKTQQRNAVDMSDTDAFDSAQTQIEALEKESTPAEAKPQQPGTDPAIVEWQAKNAWINDNNDERTPVAQGVWNSYVQQNPNASVEQAIAHVDGRMSKLYPSNNTNARRDAPNVTETGRRTSRRQGKSLTMADLTSEEKQDYQLFGSTMFTEAEFLKTVTDTRAK